MEWTLSIYVEDCQVEWELSILNSNVDNLIVSAFAQKVNFEKCLSLYFLLNHDLFEMELVYQESLFYLLCGNITEKIQVFRVRILIGVLGSSFLLYLCLNYLLFLLVYLHWGKMIWKKYCISVNDCNFILMLPILD